MKLEQGGIHEMLYWEELFMDSCSLFNEHHHGVYIDKN